MAIKRTKRELKKEMHERNIQKAVSDLLLQYDFDTVTLDDICEAASINKSTFYNLYSSKEDLLMIDADKNRDIFLKQHYKYDPSLPLRECFERFFLVNFDFLLKDTRERSRQVYRSYLSTGDLRGTGNIDHAYIRGLYQLIDRGISEGNLIYSFDRDLIFRAITDQLLGIYIGWAVHISDEAGLDEKYKDVIIAFANSIVKN